jgi:SOS-response transcriptional repressor LexA
MNSIPQGESFTSPPPGPGWDKIYMGLKEFTAARLAELDRNPFEAARIGKLERTFVRDILIDRKKTVLGRNLERLAVALDTTPEIIASAISGRSPASPPVPRARATREVLRTGVAVPDPATLPRDLPVFGKVSAAVVPGGPRGQKVNDGFVVDEAIDYVGRPPGVAKAGDAYAVYVAGDSMAPMHSAGELRVVHPHRPVRPGDTVIVQVRTADGGPISGFIKTYNGRSGDWLVVSQLNPKALLRLKLSTVVAVHRVLSTAELLGV